MHNRGFKYARAQSLDMVIPARVLVVMGSPRKGNTYRAAERLRALMEADGPVAFEYLWLRDAALEQCRGCAVCVGKGEEYCPIRDDVPAIVQKMREADGIILASPVFSWQVSGLMKVLIDRLSYTMHRPQLYGKKVLVLATGMLSTRDVERYLTAVARFWGAEVVAKVGLITPPTVSARQLEKNERILATAAASFSRALRPGRRTSPPLRSVLYFRGGRALIDEQQDETPTDYRYWKERGWLDPAANYYTDTPVNPVYTAIGRLAEFVMRRAIRFGWI
jgi:multimeric flavodoxin WrbA